MKRSRPSLFRVSEEMKAWSAALAEEVAGWPAVTIRPFFGLLGVYRRRRIFAVLPRTRSMDLPNSIGFKLPPSRAHLRQRARRDQRVHFPEGEMPQWLAFELASSEDLRGALKWLNLAYEGAGRRS